MQSRVRKSNYLPKSNEVRQTRRHDEQTVEECIAEEKHEELVIVEADAIVDPRAVVVHLEHASRADAAVVRPVRLHEHTAVAVADRT